MRTLANSRRKDQVRKETIVFSDTKRMSTSPSEPLNEKIGAQSIWEAISTAVLEVPERQLHNSFLQIINSARCVL